MNAGIMEAGGNINIFVAMIFVLSLNLQISDAVMMPYFKGENEQSATVEVKVRTTETRQRWSADPFPDQLDIDLSTEKIQQKCRKLKRNYHIPNIRYVDMWDNGEIKPFRYENKEKAAYYTDVTTGAAFRVCLKSGGSEEFDIYGTFMSGEIEYLVQPAKTNHSTYTVSRIPKTMLSDYVRLADVDIIPEESQERSQQTTQSNREKRQTTVYEIEIYFVHDFSTYTSWYATTEGESDRDTATINKMTQYTSFLLNAIDLRYQTVTDYPYTISCIYAGIYIANSAEGAPFANYSDPYGQVVANTLLDDFRAWGQSNLQYVGDYDHAMLFTRYDIGSFNEGVFDSGIAGLAYLPTYDTNGDLTKAATCGTNRYSINEGEEFNPTLATVAAHELGHNLGAYHDGDDNSCSDGYVMAPSYGVSSDPADNLLLWQFSSCSQTDFNTYISKLVSPFVNCMTERNATNNDQIDTYVNDLAGQTYSPDVQCERLEGNGSYLYRPYFNDDYSTICALMQCASPTTNSTVSLTNHVPWEDITCGDGKICQSGSCVESSVAPQVANESCLFGDVPYDVPFQTTGCSDFLGNRSTSYYCYSETYRESCCQTCEDIRLANTAYQDCEYGDKASWCVNVTLNVCSVESNRMTCCVTCEDLKLDIPDCEYGDTASWCDTLTLRHCSVESNRLACCLTCDDLRLDIPGCPWGDDYSNCADFSCETIETGCCQTCPNTTATSTTTTTVPSSTPTTTTTTSPTTMTTTPTTTFSPTTTTTIPTTTETTQTTTNTSPTTTTPTPITLTATPTTTTTPTPSSPPSTTTTSPTATTTTSTSATQATTTISTTTSSATTTSTSTTTTTTSPTTTTTTPTTTSSPTTTTNIPTTTKTTPTTTNTTSSATTTSTSITSPTTTITIPATTSTSTMAVKSYIIMAASLFFHSVAGKINM